MDTILKGNADEINQSLVDFIKKSFKGKKIAVHIYEDDQDETDFLLSDPETKKRLLKSIKQVSAGKGLKEFSLEEIKKMAS